MSEVRPGNRLPDLPLSSSASNSADASQPLWTRAEVANLVDQERAQIGHDLHDDLIPLLFAARARAELLAAQFGANESGANEFGADDSVGRDQALAASLSQLAAWLNGAMQWSRRLLGSIHCDDFSIRTWKEAAQDQVSEICRDVDLVWQLDQEALHLSNDFAAVACRITVESIRNAVKHGKAKRICVVSTVDEEGYRISVIDNGRGFNPEAVSGDHYGLRIMRRRAELVAGKLSIRSGPGESTVVELLLPHTQPS